VLLPDGTLDSLYLAVEVRGPGPYTGVADAQATKEKSEGTTELGAVVSLDTAKGEREGVEKKGNGAADGSGGALGEDGGSQEAAAVVHQGELVASLG
jgi:hypothetical protein